MESDTGHQTDPPPPPFSDEPADTAADKATQRNEAGDNAGTEGERNMQGEPRGEVVTPEAMRAAVWEALSDPAVISQIASAVLSATSNATSSSSSASGSTHDGKALVSSNCSD